MFSLFVIRSAPHLFYPNWSWSFLVGSFFVFLFYPSWQVLSLLTYCSCVISNNHTHKFLVLFYPSWKFLFLLFVLVFHFFMNWNVLFLLVDVSCVLVLCSFLPKLKVLVSFVWLFLCSVLFVSLVRFFLCSFLPKLNDFILLCVSNNQTHRLLVLF